MATPSTGVSELFARRCIDSLTGLVAVSSCAFYRVDDALRPYGYVLHRLAGRTHDTYLSHFQHLDPLLPSRVAGGCQSIVTMDDVLPGALRRQSGYASFMAHHDMADVTELFVRCKGRVVAGLSLIRGASLGRFGREELAALDPLHGLIELAAHSALDAEPNAAALTPREREIAGLIRDGRSNKLIARQLGLELSTVKTHLQRLFRKLGVHNRTELVATLFLD